MNGFERIEVELKKRRDQDESVKGKDTPFRVEFRYRRGTRHYQYFVALADAHQAKDSRCSYNPWGYELIDYPLSQQIQRRGPRGGWKRFQDEKGEV